MFDKNTNEDFLHHFKFYFFQVCFRLWSLRLCHSISKQFGNVQISYDGFL